MRPGFEGKVPKTADEFAAYFQISKIGHDNVAEFEAQKLQYSEDKLIAFRESARAERAEHLSKESSYLISYPFVLSFLRRASGASLTLIWAVSRIRMQVRLAMVRRFQMQMGELPTLIITTVAAIFQALIIVSRCSSFQLCPCAH